MQVTGSVISRQAGGNLILNHPFAQTGGALFAITADWCGHCVTLKSDVLKAQKIKPFKFFFFDGGKDDFKTKAKINEIGVSGFPSLFKVHKGGLLTPYNGPRNPMALAATFF